MSRRRTGIDYYDENGEIECPKIKMSSEISGKNDSGIKVATEKLMLYLDAGLPIIYIDTFEENKADEIINRVAVERDIYEWNNAEGLFKREEYSEHVANFDNRMSLKETLQNFIDDVRSLQYGATIKCQLKNSVLVLKDVHKYFDDESIVAQLKYLAQLIYTGKLEDCTIIIVSSVLKVPTVLEHYLTILKIENLNEGEIEELIVNFCEEHGTKKPSDILLKKLLSAFKGMSEFDIINILSLALAEENDITFSDLDLIIENKKQIIRKTNILEMVECDEKEDDIGGLENLKAWLKKKENTFRHVDEAIRFGVRIPKGILIVGMPGCGKTLTAKATAAIFGLPLLKFDIGRILGKYVGESEKNMRRAIELAEVTAPCVLWIDELEKAFASIGGDGGGEITVRLLGLFLTWMQEKTSPVFVVATANDVNQLPQELIRKGRFDEIFYVGIPNSVERKKIFEIHTNKVRYNDNFEWRNSDNEYNEKIDKLVKSTLGRSGADIASFVDDAVERAFSEFVEAKKYSTAKSQVAGEEKKKPVFNLDMVQSVINDAGQISAWNQLKRIFGNYKRKRFKNASDSNFSDVIYWVNLRLTYIAKSPQRVLDVIKMLGNITGKFIHDYGVEQSKIWDKEEKVPKYVRFYREVAKKFFGLFEDKKKKEVPKVSLIEEAKTANTQEKSDKKDNVQSKSEEI
ncbi:MAG: AAA family ATPase [Selenomonadaceae bacterium]|nr:AAA family ATPase [Selenomonadaceae bacterium]